MSSNISKTPDTPIAPKATHNNDTSRYNRFSSWLASTQLIQSLGNTWLGKLIIYIYSWIRNKFTTASPDQKIVKQLLESISVALESKNAKVSSAELFKKRDLLIKFISDKWTVYAEQLIEQNDKTGEELLSLIKTLATYQFQPPSKIEEDEGQNNPLNDLFEFCHEKPQLDPPLIEELLILSYLDDAIDSKQNLEHAQKELSEFPTTDLQIKHDMTTEEGLALQIQEEASLNINESIPQQLLQTQINMYLKQCEVRMFHFAKYTKHMLGDPLEGEEEAVNDLMNKIGEDSNLIHTLKEKLEHTKMLRAVVLAHLEPTDANVATAGKLSAPFCLNRTRCREDLAVEFREELHKECLTYLRSHGNKAIQRFQVSGSQKDRAINNFSSLSTKFYIGEAVVTESQKQAKKLLEQRLNRMHADSDTDKSNESSQNLNLAAPINNGADPVEGNKSKVTQTLNKEELVKLLLTSISISLDNKNELILSTDLLERRKILLTFISDKWTEYANKLIEQNNEVGQKLFPLIQRLAKYPVQGIEDNQKLHEVHIRLLDNINSCLDGMPQQEEFVEDMTTLYQLDEAIDSKQKLEQAQKELQKLQTTNLPIKHDLNTEDGLSLQIQDEATQQINEFLPQQLLQTKVHMYSTKYGLSMLAFAKCAEHMCGAPLEPEASKEIDNLFDQIQEDQQHIQNLNDQLEHATMLRAIVLASLDSTRENVTTAAKLSAKFCLLKARIIHDKLEEQVYKECKEYLMHHGQAAIRKLEGTETSKELVNKTLSSLCARFNLPEIFFILTLQEAKDQYILK